MEQNVFPFECNFKVRIREDKLFELTMLGLPHPTDPEGSIGVVTTGRTLGEAFFNMGHQLTLSFEEAAPGFLDWAIVDEPYFGPAELLRYPERIGGNYGLD